MWWSKAGAGRLRKVWEAPGCQPGLIAGCMEGQHQVRWTCWGTPCAQTCLWCFPKQPTIHRTQHEPSAYPREHLGRADPCRWLPLPRASIKHFTLKGVCINLSSAFGGSEGSSGWEGVTTWCLAHHSTLPFCHVCQ